MAGVAWGRGEKGWERGGWDGGRGGSRVEGWKGTPMLSDEIIASWRWMALPTEHGSFLPMC